MSEAMTPPWMAPRGLAIHGCGAGAQPLGEALVAGEADGLVEAGKAVVVDDEGRLRGSVGRHAVDDNGIVADHVERIEAWIPSDGSLQDALAAMLLTRGGWIAVIDDDDSFRTLLFRHGDPRPRTDLRTSGRSVGLA